MTKTLMVIVYLLMNQSGNPELTMHVVYPDYKTCVVELNKTLRLLTQDGTRHVTSAKCQMVGKG